MAPSVAGRISDMVRSGALKVSCGRVASVEAHSGSLRVSIRRPGDRVAEIDVQWIIDASGVDYSLSEDHLLARLRDTGLIIKGPLGLGVRVDASLHVVDAACKPRPRVLALGPITRGVFWECTSVPDIRVQAEKLAGEIARMS